MSHSIVRLALSLCRSSLGDTKTKNFSLTSCQLFIIQVEKLTENKKNITEVKKRRSSFIRGRKVHSPLEICQSERLAAVQGMIMHPNFKISLAT